MRYGVWAPLDNHQPVRFTSGARKVVHHKTVTKPTTNYAALYRYSGPPHWTVGPTEVAQHFETNVGARALKNVVGGVETNSANAYQIEVEGFPGVDMDDDTFNNLVDLLKAIRHDLGIPWDWPSGRPRPAAPGPRDPGGHNRSSGNWLKYTGHYDHGSVPENSHWDTAYTDWEWFMLNAAMVPQATEYVIATWKVSPMFNPPVPVVAGCAAPDGGGWLVSQDGAVFTLPPAPYLGGANGKHYFTGRQAARIEPAEGGYQIIATSGEVYGFPE